MSDYTAPRVGRYLPQVAFVTTIVALLPIALVWTLRADKVISSTWLCLLAGMALSLALSSAGGAYWRKRGSGDVLFSELLLWGWLWRWHVERQLASATKLLERARTGRDNAALVEHHAHLLRRLATALEAQDRYLNGHSRRVARHTAMIARRMGLSREEVARIRAAAAIHDVGKLWVPWEVLNKPGALTADEFAIIKQHAVAGAEMVAALGDPEFTSIVRHHHERIDGKGYPDRLQGEEIPIGARIIAVADTFDAITSPRPYRSAARHKQAIDIIEQASGSQLDPVAVRAFLSYYSGNWTVALWTFAVGGVERTLAWVTGESVAAAVSTGKLAGVVLATAAVGAASAAVPVAPHHNSSTGASVILPGAARHHHPGADAAVGAAASGGRSRHHGANVTTPTGRHGHGALNVAARGHHGPAGAGTSGTSTSRPSTTSSGSPQASVHSQGHGHAYGRTSHPTPASHPGNGHAYGGGVGGGKGHVNPSSHTGGNGNAYGRCHQSGTC